MSNNDKLDAEVAVVGVGTMGSMALWQLAEAGISAIGFEQFGIGHDRSAGGGETRIFRTAYLEGPEYVPLLQESRRLWRQLERDTGFGILTQSGALMIGSESTQSMQNVVESVRKYELPHEVLSPGEMRALYPQHRIFDDEMAILDYGAGVLRPEFAIIAAATRARQLGAQIYDKRAVTEIAEDDDTITIVSGDKQFRVRKVVITAGPWTGALMPELADAITVQRIVMTWFATAEPALYEPSRFPVFIREALGEHVFGIPSVDGGSVKAALTAGYGSVPDADSLQRDLDPSQLQRINDFVSETLPGLHPYPHRVSVHMDGYTADGDPYVGAHRAHPNIISLGGFSGHGFKMSPVMGAIARDLVVDGTTDRDISHIDLGRLT